MENHNLLLKLSRLFPSSFTSCQARTRPDVVVADSSVSFAKSKKNPFIKNDPSNSPLSRKHPKPDKINHSSRHSDAKGRKCPPASTTGGVRNQSSSSYSGRWFTSSDERMTRVCPAEGGAFDTDTFYSMSSNSGDSFRARATARRQQLAATTMKRIDETSKCMSRERREPVGSDHASTRLYYDDSGCRRLRRRRRRRPRKSTRAGAIEEGVAVEKRSSDPYGDFMGSMVEMIVEKQMFGEEDLDRLLSCYLSLNKVEYHGIIFKVFHEICQTLLCN